MLLPTGISLLPRSRELHFQVRPFVNEMQKIAKNLLLLALVSQRVRQHRLL